MAVSLTVQARNQYFICVCVCVCVCGGGGGGGANEGEVDLPKLLQTTKCIFYPTRLFRKVAIHEKL